MSGKENVHVLSRKKLSSVFESLYVNVYVITIVLYKDEKRKYHKRSVGLSNSLVLGSGFWVMKTQKQKLPSP